MRKNMKKMAVLAVACVSILGVFMAQSFAQTSDFESSPAWNKLDGGMQNAYLAAKKAGDMTRSIECIVRMKSAERGNSDFLQSEGFNVKTFAGLMGRGNIKAQDVPDVANLYFVASIVLAGN